MPLPKLEVPKYTLEIPSSGEVIEYRPFLVKEEKNLLIAQETGDGQVILEAMKDIVKMCCFNKIDLEKLHTYDLEYIFLQIRAKAVGETIDVAIKCDDCQQPVPVKIDITEVQVKKPNTQSEKTIPLSENVGIILKPLSVDSIGTLDNASDLNATIRAVIKSIYDADTVYDAADSSEEELNEFIDQIPHKALLEINEFLSGLPYLALDVEFPCKNKECETKKCKKELKGFTDFFA